MSAQYAKTSKNTFRNMALGFTGAMFVAAFALYASKKHVDGRRKADLESYEAELARRPQNSSQPSTTSKA
ncbi:hypothetical protein C8J55DRAFT_528586 [Lentinula edodes]|uniref:Cytochrome c oxidase assembly factor 3 n=1 Tax=Lentinula lateritia TaxID=40482 RepID=A0A9W8ZTP5_9AGAR|nr:hypothetical protein C8J55DRAFT_528586 [Lentinula edodes]